METNKNSIKPHKDRVLAIALVGQSEEVLDQQFLLIKDKNAHYGIHRYHIAEGGIKVSDSAMVSAIQRKFSEEVGTRYKKVLFKKFGCYQKKRSGGYSNQNHLFVIKLNFSPDEKFSTDDISEVSDMFILKLKEIIILARSGLLHESSMRLIFLYLKKIKTGSLNDPITWNGYTF